jgi:catechol 2,3-dioxygenase-like lactoylglutathione lyase family enzyme
MNSTPKFGFVLEYVTDIEAARRFYVDVLGLEVERQAPAFIQFKNFAIANDASLTGKREPEVYWLVDDVESVYKQLSPKTEVIFPLKQMPFGKVFGIQDPAGRPLFLLEFSKERPSQAVK